MYDAHLMCSESFYKRTLFEDIQSDPQASTHTKTEMLEVLRRLEKSGLSDDERDPETGKISSASSDSIDSVDEEDLDQMSTEQLLRLLSPEQINQFQSTLQHADLDPALFYQTIKSSYSTPWWLLLNKTDTNDCEEILESLQTDSIDFTKIPKILPAHMLPPLPSSPNPKLIFQIITVMLSQHFFNSIHLSLFDSQSALNLTIEDQTDIFLRTTEAVSSLFHTQATGQVFDSLSDCHAFCCSKLGIEPSKVGEIVDLLSSDLDTLAREKIEKAKRSCKIVEIVPDESASTQDFLASALSDLHDFLDHLSSKNNSSSDLIDQARSTIGRTALKKAILKLRFFVTFILKEPAGVDELWDKIDREMVASRTKGVNDELEVVDSKTSLLCLARPANNSILEDISSTSAKIVELT
ncbi:uncharacterized protein MELLADRAFT_67685 [Melampsora larici-populina 98AG31]|uniref:Uncharacterized protein n=1 Tax=Melampsora larici-populina (strain 98AG31 / pathotype 3-4-7) TaxID=747676 RepID=F4S422_MELLP|nr:uncharacterized protein MELLADRAFT_67685 [Melampsora larici-populina 98AG31]EGG00631.1 hypothetical protein MELLADRAFT_67685 [Melampsora larici-populina 98AG31]